MVWEDYNMRTSKQTEQTKHLSWSVLLGGGGEREGGGIIWQNFDIKIENKNPDFKLYRDPKNKRKKIQKEPLIYNSRNI